MVVSCFAKVSSSVVWSVLIFPPTGILSGTQFSLVPRQFLKDTLLAFSQALSIECTLQRIG